MAASPDYSQAPATGETDDDAASWGDRFDAGGDADEGEASEGGEDLAFDAFEGGGERLDRFLAARLPGVSRSRIQHWIALGAVRCDERALQAKTKLSGRERIHVHPLPREADQAFEPDPVPLEVVHEDPWILVIDKPAGLVVHPAAGNWRGTLLNGLLHRDPACASLPRAGIVHRLDKDTSGLMVVGRSEAACMALVSQLADRSMSRRYLAVVAGVPAQAGRIDRPIGRDPRLRTRMAVVEGPGGKPAVTHWRRLASGRLGSLPVSLVECRLETGRTHQIRVHLASLGHPLQGDTLYGGRGEGIGRQALHAWSLGLNHPSDGLARRWMRSPPDDFRALAQAAGLGPDEHFEALRHDAN